MTEKRYPKFRNSSTELHTWQGFSHSLRPELAVETSQIDGGNRTMVVSPGGKARTCIVFSMGRTQVGG